MLLTKDQRITALFIFLFIASAVAGFIWGSHLTNPPERKPVAVYGSPVGLINPMISSDTILIRDQVYLCGDVEKLSEETVPGNMVGLDRKTLMERFPTSEGWVVSFTNPKFLTLTINSGEFCPVHRNYLHLGIDQGMVAVYEGPIEFHEKVLRIENIPVESLEPGLRKKLEQVMALGEQAPTTVGKLREEFEFTSEEFLNAALENLDENS